MAGLDAYADEVYDVIKAYLGVQWGVTLIQWPNDDTFERPMIGGVPQPFIAFEITGDLYEQVSIGGGAQQAQNRWDETGRIWLHVFVKAGTGHTKARGAAKALANLFRGARMLNDRLEFMDASIGEGEPGDDNGVYWRVSVSIEWGLTEA